MDQKQIFEQFINHVITLGIPLWSTFVRTGPKAGRTDWRWIHFEEKFEWIKSETACNAYAPSDYLLKILNWIKNYTHAFICASKLPKSVTQTLWKLLISNFIVKLYRVIVLNDDGNSDSLWNSPKLNRDRKCTLERIEIESKMQ